MRLISIIFQRILFYQIILILQFSLAAAATVPLRLDLYDRSDNHLMFMTFTYNAEGRNTGRSVFMADSTFMRSVAINYNTLGQRTGEVSYNSNGDTLYVTEYQQAQNETSFSMQDQFKLDLAGDRIVYSNANRSNFELVYKQSGERAATVAYTKNTAGDQLGRVDIAGQFGSDSYYGLFTYGEAAGVTRGDPAAGKLPLASIQVRASGIMVNFTLQSPGVVRCELLTLSGRRAAVLFSGTIQKGPFTHHFNLDRDAGRLSAGVYLFRISVDGAGISQRRYLHQSLRTGGIQ